MKSDKKLIVIKGPDENVETGIKKIGAFLGDNVEVGCGSVLNPGTIVGRESNIYPLSSVRGCVPAKSIYKNTFLSSVELPTTAPSPTIAFPRINAQ